MTRLQRSRSSVEPAAIDYHHMEKHLHRNPLVVASIGTHCGGSSPKLMRLRLLHTTQETPCTFHARRNRILPQPNHQALATCNHRFLCFNHAVRNVLSSILGSTLLARFYPRASHSLGLCGKNNERPSHMDRCYPVDEPRALLTFSIVQTRQKS